jgi:beta-lactamase class A
MSRDDAALESRIDGITAEAGGTIAVAAWHLTSGARVARLADEAFPSASVIKVPILVELFGRVADGREDLQSRVTLREEDKVEGSGVLRELHAGSEFTLVDLARLMIVVSDNTATNLLIDRLGVDAVNARMAALGLERTRLGRKMYDLAARDRGIDNLCAAGEMVALLYGMERGTVVSPAASAEMLAIMKRQSIVTKIPRLLPPGTIVANKTGEITGVSHDAGIIYAPGGPIALAVLTRGCRDSVAAQDAISRVARAIFDAWGGGEAEESSCPRTVVSKSLTNGA